VEGTHAHNCDLSQNTNYFKGKAFHFPRRVRGLDGMTRLQGKGQEDDDNDLTTLLLKPTQLYYCNWMTEESSA